MWTSTRPGALALLLGVVAARAAGTAVVYQFNHLSSAGAAFFRAAETTVISAREGLQITVSGPYKLLNLALAADERCYRLVLGARHDTVKHADARAINTRITADGAAVIVPVTDDGHGLDPAAVQPCHLGLRTIRKRAAAIGVTLDVISAPGEAPPSGFSCPKSPVISEPAASPAAGA